MISINKDRGLIGTTMYNAPTQLKHSPKIVCISEYLFNFTIHYFEHEHGCKNLLLVVTWHAKKHFLCAGICCAYYYFISFCYYIIDCPNLLYCVQVFE